MSVGMKMGEIIDFTPKRGDKEIIEDLSEALRLLEGVANDLDEGSLLHQAVSSSCAAMYQVIVAIRNGNRKI